MILLIDNYDSFTYNLVHLLRELTDKTIAVCRNDKIELSQVAEFDKILLSPGPGIPKEAGIMPAVVKEFGVSKSILGICLGHQCIAEEYGAALFNMPKVVHGMGSKISVAEPRDPLFEGVESPFVAGRYHSWAVDKPSLPTCFRVTAESEDGMIMGISHNSYDLKGLQFHPESILTDSGQQIIRNWLEC